MVGIAEVLGTWRKCCGGRSGAVGPCELVALVVLVLSGCLENVEEVWSFPVWLGSAFLVPQELSG